MSIYYSAKLVYGVYLTSDEIKKAKENPNWDEIYDRWVIAADAYSKDSDFIVGIIKYIVGDGETTELDDIETPDTEAIDSLLEILDTLHINRDPTWHLVCSIL